MFRKGSIPTVLSSGVVVAALALAACGDDNSNSSTSGSTTTGSVRVAGSWRAVDRPLFLANAVACIAAIAALTHPATRGLAALAGVVISASALAGLVVAYGRQGGLFGWPEGGFRTAIVLAVITELAAVVLLSTALAATTGLLQARRGRTRPAHGAEGPRDDELPRLRQFPSLQAGGETTA